MTRMSNLVRMITWRTRSCMAMGQMTVTSPGPIHGRCILYVHVHVGCSYMFVLRNTQQSSEARVYVYTGR